MYKISTKTLQTWLAIALTMLIVIGVLIGLLIGCEMENYHLRQEFKIQSEIQSEIQYEKGYEQAKKDCTPVGFNQDGQFIITYNGFAELYDVDARDIGLTLIPFL